MRILGIDTSSRYLSIGACDGAKSYSYNLDAGIKHSALLMPSIKRILGALRWGIEDIDYFACGLGPGSFTGLRIGLAAIKGLAFVNRKPVVGIPTLDILAAAAQENKGYLMPAIDAKRNFVYCCVYKSNQGKLIRQSGLLLLKKSQFLKKIKKGSVLFGDACALYRQEILDCGRDAVILDRDYWYPKGHFIVKLAQERKGKARRGNADSMQPVYLFPRECQIREAVTSKPVTRN